MELFNLTWAMGNISFVKTQDGYLARQKGGIDGSVSRPIRGLRVPGRTSRNLAGRKAGKQLRKVCARWWFALRTNVRVDDSPISMVSCPYSERGYLPKFFDDISVDSSMKLVYPVMNPDVFCGIEHLLERARRYNSNIGAYISHREVVAVFHVQVANGIVYMSVTSAFDEGVVPGCVPERWIKEIAGSFREREHRDPE
jgi:hypothetical protein